MVRISPVAGHYVTIDVQGGEYKVFFLEHGAGRPLVCQHTAGCHNHQWRDLLEDEEITDRYRVIAYDLARHGKSDPPHNKEWWKEEYRLTADFYTEFIVAFCDALELDDPIFMGSSFGGNVALQLALRYPERFAGVIPVEAADYSPGFYLDWWQHPQANAAQVCASGVWDLMAPQSPERDRRLTWFYYTQGSEAFKGDLYFYSVDHDLRDRLGEIDGERCPVVMLTGDYDYLTTPEDGRRTASQIKGAEFIEMKDIGHFPMSENYPRGLTGIHDDAAGAGCACGVCRLQVAGCLPALRIEDLELRVRIRSHPLPQRAHEPRPVDAAQSGAAVLVDVVVVAAADLALEDGHRDYLSRNASENYMARWMNRMPGGSPGWRDVDAFTRAAL